MLDYTPVTQPTTTTHHPTFLEARLEPSYNAQSEMSGFLDQVLNSGNEYFSIRHHLEHNSIELRHLVSHQALSVSEMVQEIRSIFGLNASQLARLVDVSRASYYNHVSGKERPINTDNYERLYRAAIAVKEVSSTGVSDVLKTVLVDGKTILSHLNDGYADYDNIAQIAQSAIAKAPQRTQPENISVEQQRVLAHSVSRAG